MFETPPRPPESIAVLLDRARGLAGWPLGRVARRFGLPVPPDLRRHKGWIGQLLETALGASAGSRAVPDFPHLGVEMKSLPVTAQGRPRESTYVCTAPLDGSLEPTWEESWVRRKLSTVLWVPVVGDAATSPGERVVGTAWLWSPSADEDAALRRDFEQISALIATGELWHLDATHGEVMQLRPKAANRDQGTWALDQDSEWVRANPRGFYLRPAFTRGLLSRALRLL